MVIRWAAAFLAIAGIVLWNAGSGPLWASAVRVSVALSVGIVGLAYAGLGPRVFFKRKDGTLPWFVWLIHWPYLLGCAGSLALHRLFSKENRLDEILPGLLHGGRLSAADAKLFRDGPPSAVLDLTCEFQETTFLREVPSYLCLPVLDNTAPTPDQLRRGAEWLRDRRSGGSVYVHCALGHGRSTALIAAYLILTKRAADIDQAMELIRSARPKAKLHPNQLAAVASVSDIS